MNHFYRVSGLARFIPYSDHYSDGHYGADGPLPASTGPVDSHSTWDSAAPWSFATSSTCFSCALRAFCFSWWFWSSWWCYTWSGTFHSCSWGPLLSTRGAYYLIIRSLLSLFYLYLHSMFLDVIYILDHFYTGIGCIPCLSCTLYSISLYRHLPFCVY